MAKEKTRIDRLLKPATIKKTRKDKRVTDCHVNIRIGCGICRSRDTVTQGVEFCTMCGAEAEFLTDREWYRHVDYEVPCDCVKTYKDKQGTVWGYRPINNLYVGKCVTCGSTKSNLCPNCKLRECWNRWDGKVYCRNCGYRRKERE